jgi:hypothetical protein
VVSAEARLRLLARGCADESIYKAAHGLVELRYAAYSNRLRARGCRPVPFKCGPATCINHNRSLWGPTPYDEAINVAQEALSRRGYREPLQQYCKTVPAHKGGIVIDSALQQALHSIVANSDCYGLCERESIEDCSGPA